MLVDITQRSVVNINHHYTLERVSESSVIIRALGVASENSNVHLSSLQINNALVNEYLSKIQRQLPNWLIDYVVAYDSLLLEFDIMQIDIDGLCKWLREVVEMGDEVSESNDTANTVRHHQIEVCYDYCTGSHPNDLPLVAKYCGLLPSELIQLHQSVSYQVFAIGFMPHFAYLGELPSALAMPRLNEPRLKVPAGAVAIADNQTAVYPNDSPGGWHIIAYTHFRFDNGADSVIRPNDKVSFTAIDLETFEKNTTSLTDINV